MNSWQIENGVEMLSLKKFEAPVKSTEASNRPGIPNPMGQYVFMPPEKQC